MPTAGSPARISVIAGSDTYKVEAVMKIDDLRKKIDRIDRTLVDLINERTSYAVKIGKIKRETRRGVYSPEREKAVYKRLSELSRGPLPLESLRAIYREIMSAAMALEKDIVVAFIGPEATFSHLAAHKKFGSSIRYAPLDTITEIFAHVAKGTVNYGVVPIENTIEGAVTHTLDMFIDYKVKICAELYLDITHCLLANCDPSEIKTIYSNPLVFAQCRNWLNTNFPKVRLLGVTSTAKGTEIASKEKGAAAIANELAAEIYGLRIVERGIEDSGRNETRFLVIGTSAAGPSGEDKTSIVVSIADRVGALHRMLYPFKKHAINLTKIESRPSKKKAWEYYFFIDFIGHIDDGNVVKALKELQKQCLFVEHLGSYPRAR